VRRAPKLFIWGAASLVATPVVLLAGLIAVANTDPGRRLVERVTVGLSAGRVVVSGLAGAFPSDLRAATLELRDARGPWLTATDVTLSSSPSQLIWRHAQVALLHAGHILVARAPASPASRQSDSPPFVRRVDVERIEITQLEIGPALAGAAAVLELHGRIHIGVAGEARATLSARRLDGPGTYEFAGDINAEGVSALLDAHEPADGPLANLAGLPGLGAWSLQLRIAGPRAAETAHLALAAGPLHGTVDGTVNWTGGVADLEVTVGAPSMALRTNLSWEGLSIQGHYHGAFTAPAVTAQLRVTGAQIGGVRFRGLGARIRGDAGTATLTATLEGLRVPGPNPAVLESSPLELRMDATLGDSERPVTFSLSHPLISVRGRATTADRPSVTFAATLPSLAPFAAVMGMDLRGQCTVSANLSSSGGDFQATVNGTMSGVGGSAVLARLVEPAATFDMSVTRRGTTLTVDHARLDGGALRASLVGADRDGVLDLRWRLDLPKLAALAPTLAGFALAHGDIRGERGNYGGSGDVKADVAVHGSRPGSVEIAMRARGLPRDPAVTLEAHGTLDESPLRLGAVIDHETGGGTHAVIQRAEWKSAIGSGDLTFPAGSLPARGRLSLLIPHLEDLQRITGEPLQGSVTSSVDLLSYSGHSRAEFRLEALRAGVPDAQVGHLVVAGHVDEPAGDPVIALQAVGDGIVTPTLSGNARLEVVGPTQGLTLKLSSQWHTDGAETADVSSAATLDLTNQRLGVATMEAKYRGQTARLLAPTNVSFRDGVSFDAIRVGVQTAVLEVAGTLSPTLDVTTSIKNAPLTLLTPFVPDWQAEGMVTADARLGGTLAAPEGTVHVSATGLRLRRGPGRAVPLTDVVGTAVLHGDAATVDLHVHADTAADLHLVGQVPLRYGQSFAMHANGQMALATANPLLEPNGRRVRGQATIEATFAGTAAAPQLTGTIVIDHGEFQDFARGMHLSEISATLQATDRSVRVTRFLAHAGSGTVSAEGTIGLFEPTLPVDLRLTAVNAKPLSSDLLTAQGDATLTVRGEANGQLEAIGRIHVDHADINIPNALPRAVAVLDVRRPGAKPAPPPNRTATVIRLDLAVDAPRAVFVRGRGLDAELGGNLHVSGTTETPQVSGGFDMRRGTFALAGASLKFSRGKVSFNGAGVKHTLDPTLDFVADTISADVTATLTVAGYASAPTVVLTSTPELPQDEILARLLFGVSAKQLTPLQLLRIGAALASISGSGNRAADPLSAIQKRLGLDRLVVGGGGGPEGNAATVEAGRYATERVYVGAAQSTAGTTKLQVQVDLTKHLKLQTVVGSGSAAAQGTTPQNDPGNTVGLTYQIDF
jgi:translocation and assembly module TamB